MQTVRVSRERSKAPDSALTPAIRRTQKRDDLLIKFSAGLNLWKTMVINVTDSAFDNLPTHRSQGGHFIML
eukprot:5634522-Pyramimonas_sp.AAC.1